MKNWRSYGKNSLSEIYIRGQEKIRPIEFGDEALLSEGKQKKHKLQSTKKVLVLTYACEHLMYVPHVHLRTSI